jgi:putative acetyltransferase
MRIRPVKKEDCQQLYDISSEGGVRDGINSLSGKTLEDMRQLLANLTVRDHFLVIESETPPAEVVGAILLRVFPRGALRNMATMEVMVKSSWQGQGLGRALLQAAMELADDELMIERTEVEITTDNEHALKLYKSFGFKVEGVAKDWMIKPDGTYADAYLLARLRSQMKPRANKKPK